MGYCAVLEIWDILVRDMRKKESSSLNEVWD